MQTDGLLVGGDDYIDDLVQAEPKHEDKPAKKIYPWHKPRKHWIREHQWQAGAAWLIDELDLVRKNRPLSYMTLPGPDMLDVRAMQKTCASRGVPLNFLGFMKGTHAQNTELNISRAEVLSLDHVVESSTVIPDLLQSLADPLSVGSQNFSRTGPFDIVNVDLCGSMGHVGPEHEEAYYSALKEIIDAQRTRRPPNEPWILFLTTRANPETINDEARQRLLECLLGNMRDHVMVREAVDEALHVGIADVEAYRDGNYQAGKFESTFAASVSKWFLKLVGTGAPVGTVELLDTSCVYGVRHPEDSDMLSLGFVFRTQIAPANDGAGLAGQGAASATLSEPEAACIAIRRVPDMTNVDVLLRSTPGLYAEVSAAAAEAMRVARFDPDEYLRKAQAWKEAPQDAAVAASGSFA